MSAPVVKQFSKQLFQGNKKYIGNGGTVLESVGPLGAKLRVPTGGIDTSVFVDNNQVTMSYNGMVIGNAGLNKMYISDLAGNAQTYFAQFYVNNAAAVADGVPVGAVYYNTTIGTYVIAV